MHKKQKMHKNAKAHARTTRKGHGSRRCGLEVRYDRLAFWKLKTQKCDRGHKIAVDRI